MNENPGDPTGFNGGLAFMYANQKPAILVGVGTVSLFGMVGRTRATMNVTPSGPRS